MGEFGEMLSVWKENVSADEIAELVELENSPEDLKEAFYRELSFGTAGLRGILGLGPNRMNVYTIGKATQGLADYLNAHYDSPSVVIARDSRNMGETFVQEAAGVLAANGIHTFVFPRIAPTPALSFAVRELGCQAGINVTASHNPAEYNGYKVYGDDGCQITSLAAKEIQAAIDDIRIFEDVRKIGFSQALELGWAKWTADSVIDAFIGAVEEQSVDDGGFSQCPLKVVYTPLNGTGLECVSRVLSDIGINDVTVVPEQAEPNGDFPTCKYPNPESKDALELALKLCEQTGADLLLATDPDADRVGIAAPSEDGYMLPTGNEVGILLLDYICSARKAKGEDLSSKVAVTTIVSSVMPDALAAHYGFQLRRVLTGFKYIGEQIHILEDRGESSRFIFGYEESYGYMSGTHVRDKDAVNASMLICEMARMYKAKGKTLSEAIKALYDKFGYFMDKTISLSYPGASGAKKMLEITSKLRSNPPQAIARRRVLASRDYATGCAMPYVNQYGDEDQTLPKADVLEYELEDGCKLLIRPSGTEPKIKAYIFASASSRVDASKRLAELEEAARAMLA